MWRTGGKNWFIHEKVLMEDSLAWGPGLDPCLGPDSRSGPGPDSGSLVSDTAVSTKILWKI